MKEIWNLDSFQNLLDSLPIIYSRGKGSFSKKKKIYRRLGVNVKIKRYLFTLTFWLAPISSCSIVNQDSYSVQSLLKKVRAYVRVFIKKAKNDKKWQNIWKFGQKCTTFENILKKGRWLRAIIASNKLLEKALVLQYIIQNSSSVWVIYQSTSFESSLFITVSDNVYRYHKVLNLSPLPRNFRA